MLEPKTYDRGEAAVEPGMVLRSLFIGQGVLSATKVLAEGEIEVLRLGPGDHFAEIGLLTGSAAGGKLTALVPTIVYELTKDDSAPVLEECPLMSGQIANIPAHMTVSNRLSTGFPSRIIANDGEVRRLSRPDRQNQAPPGLRSPRTL